ncbi:telomerase protein component 1-like [Diadema antillarum]|uniref:telomerase protein component 1-like n=1 Tax=Diadema antillarum TaxID=105358 RepID=UPI003A87AE5E
MGCGSSIPPPIADNAPLPGPGRAGSFYNPTWGPKEYKYIVKETWNKVDGTLDQLDSAQKKLVIRRSGWKTIRIFVSSTFKDFHAEREVLVKEVFPDLRQWCEGRRLHLIDCDLRWGVPKDTTSEETLRTCLGEIDRCYQDNIMPFFLNLTSERCGWIPTSQDVPLSVTNEYKWVHGLSVTEMEIMHGAYRIDNPNSLFLVRNSSFLESLPEDFKDDFLDPNPIAAHKLEILKHMLQSRLGKRVQWYDVKYSGIDDHGKVQFSGIHDNLAPKVFEFFKERISEQYPPPDVNLDPYQQAKEAHESFLKSRGSVVLGRNDILEKIQVYMTSEGSGNPLVISGGAGTGKSSIMARAADVTQTMALNKRIPGGGDTGWHVFYHFVGAIPGSTDLELCLRRVLKELKAYNEASAPKDLEACCQLACSVLSNTQTQPLVIYIDALNQFDDDQGSAILSWLPRTLAHQVRVILSMIDDTPPHKELFKRAVSPEEVVVMPLDMKARQQIVTEMLGKYNKKLDEDQMVSLLAKESSQNPLWLSIACEELRVFGLFDRINDKINSLADGLFELLEQVFTRFEEENGGMLLVATLCLLECSATGLLETELLLILGDEDNLMPGNKTGGRSEKKYHDMAPLPAAKWAVVYRALKPFIRPFGDSGEGRLDFYHRALSKAVRRKYFGNKTNKQEWWHRKLADFFSEVKSVDRKVEELPIHLIAVEDRSRLQEFLLDWSVFDHLYREDYSSTLLKYWQQKDNPRWADTLLSCYTKSLEQLAGDETSTQEEVSRRYEQVSRLVMQAGKNEEAYNLLKTAMSTELEELGARPERMVDLYGLACTCFDEVTRTKYNYFSRSQLKELRPAIDYGKKSIAIRETLAGDVHKFKLGQSLIQMAFILDGWNNCGGDNTLSRSEAHESAKDYTDRAIKIYQELGQNGYLADAVMTKGILAQQGTQEKVDLFKEAKDRCIQAYGEYSVLGARIYCNMGIMFEDDRKYTEAYECFVKWAEISHEVFGVHHPKTKRAVDTLEEPRYSAIARQVAAAEKN